MQLSRDASSKRSITRKVISTSKFARATTSRSGSEFISNSKSYNFKAESGRSKQRKINNFLDNLGSGLAESISRGGHRKHQTAKINLKNKYEQFLLKRSDKTKVLYWNSDPALSHLQKIVVSADFAFTQDCFWDSATKNAEDKPNETIKNTQRGFPDVPSSLVKDWKALHKQYFVIWVIRRKMTWSKLQEVISGFDLAVHAVFYIKKKRHYSVDFSPIHDQIQKYKVKQCLPLAESLPNNNQNDYSKAHLQRLTIFQVLKLNLKDLATYHSFAGRVPILIGAAAKVVILRIQGQPPGLQCILRYLAKAKGQSVAEGDNQIKLRSAKQRSLEVYYLSCIPQYISQYLMESKAKDVQASVFSQRQEDFDYEQQQIHGKIEDMKRFLIDKLIKQQGRSYQFEGGSSIYNFVGEMFKRNYRILQENILAGMEAERRVGRIWQGEWRAEEIALDLRVDYFEMSLN